MATNWKGYFFTIPATSGTAAQKEAYELANAFPMRLIAFESWRSKPNVREEIKAYRDDNTRNLTRITASGKKSSFEFKTMDGMKLEDKITLLSWFTSHESDAQQRKITLKYWNDEESAYKTGTFYRANTDFEVSFVDASTIYYKPATFSLIEY